MTGPTQKKNMEKVLRRFFNFCFFQSHGNSDVSVKPHFLHSSLKTALRFLEVSWAIDALNFSPYVVQHGHMSRFTFVLLNVLVTTISTSILTHILCSCLASSTDSAVTVWEESPNAVSPLCLSRDWVFITASQFQCSCRPQCSATRHHRGISASSCLWCDSFKLSRHVVTWP